MIFEFSEAIPSPDTWGLYSRNWIDTAWWRVSVRTVTKFRSGVELAGAFYSEVVRGLFDVPHTACLIGEGSEVLGYDSARSTDHEWGPRLQLFVATDHVEHVRQTVSDGLPAQFGGYPTSWYSLAQDRVAHHIEIDTLTGWLRSHFRTDLRADLDCAAWLSMPQQHLLQLTQGAVFHDDDGELTTLRNSLAWYPTDVWRWLLATQWDLIAIEQPFLGRTVEAGDTRGARLLVNRLCRLIMEMAFLHERRYWPYDKWFGTAFSELKAAATLGPLLDDALNAPPGMNASPDGPIAEALIALGHQHNGLGLTAPVVPATSHFRVGVNDAIRPYAVVNARDFINATIESIPDPALRNLPRVGSIDQLTHANDTLINFSPWPFELTRTYRDLLTPTGEQGATDHPADSAG